MGLIHEPEDYFGVAGVFCGELCPERGELVVCWTALADDLAVEAREVVNVDCAEGSQAKTCLH